MQKIFTGLENAFVGTGWSWKPHKSKEHIFYIEIILKKNLNSEKKWENFSIEKQFRKFFGEKKIRSKKRILRNGHKIIASKLKKTFSFYWGTTV